MSNITYDYNKSLPFIKAGCNGNILINGRFSKDINKKKTHVFKTLRWFIKKNPQRAHLLQEKAITKVEKIEYILRGYDNIDLKLNSLGANITRKEV